MHWKTLTVVLLAASLTVPAYAAGSTEDCSLRTVAEGGGTGPSWATVRFSKASDLWLFLVFTADTFWDNGPRMMSVQSTGDDPFFPVEATYDHESELFLQAGAGNEQVKKQASTGHIEDLSPPGGISNSDEQLTVSFDSDWTGDAVTRFMIGSDVPNDDLEWTWELLARGCGTGPSVNVVQGDQVELHTAEDLEQGNVVATGAYLPEDNLPQGVWDNRGPRATAIHGGQLDVELQNEPFVTTFWEHDAGDGIRLQGPDDVTLDDAECKGPHCRGSGSAWTSGVYEFKVDGASVPDVQQEPLEMKPDRGPYIMTASTTTPSLPS